MECVSAECVSAAEAGLRPPRLLTVSNAEGVRSTLRHDRRGGFTLALADAGAASNAHRNESCNQSDEYFLHWSSPFFTPRDAHFVPRCPVSRSVPSMRSLPPETVGHFKRDCVLGDTVWRPLVQNWRKTQLKRHSSGGTKTKQARVAGPELLRVYGREQGGP
jgi:hypothetical protein